MLNPSLWVSVGLGDLAHICRSRLDERAYTALDMACLSAVMCTGFCPGTALLMSMGILHSLLYAAATTPLCVFRQHSLLLAHQPHCFKGLDQTVLVWAEKAYQ